jgi:hypothetical protein
VTLHNTNWKSDSLATAVEISQATLHLGGSAILWDSVVFSYGPLTGTATLQIPVSCEALVECPPALNLQFVTLDAASLQSALLGAHKQGTLLSSVIARLSPSSLPPWPTFEGTVETDSLVLGPVTLHNVNATLRVSPTDAAFKSLYAELLGGQVHATGTLTKGEKPVYSLEAQFQQLSPPAVCQLFELKCTGASFEGNGKIELSGFTDKDLASSAKGQLHFDWKQGSIPGRTASSAAPLPPALVRFDHWSADADIDNGAVTLKQNQVQQGSRKSTVDSSIILGDPLKVTFAAPESDTASKP